MTDETQRDFALSSYTKPRNSSIIQFDHKTTILAVISLCFLFEASPRQLSIKIKESHTLEGYVCVLLTSSCEWISQLWQWTNIHVLY